MRPLLFTRLWLVLTALVLASAVSADAPVICNHDPSLCAEYRSLESKIDAFIPPELDGGKLLRGEIRLASAAQLSEINRLFLAVDDGVENLIFRLAKNDGTGEVVRSMRHERTDLHWNVSLLSLGVIPMDIAMLSTLLQEQELLTTALEREVDAAGKTIAPGVLAGFTERFYAINTLGTSLWEYIQTEAMNISRAEGDEFKKSYSDGRAAISMNSHDLVGQINPLQERVAALAVRLQALNGRLGVEIGKTPQEARIAASEIERRLAMSGLLVDPFANRTTWPSADAGAISGVPSRNLNLSVGQYTLKNMPRTSIPSPSPNPSPSLKPARYSSLTDLFSALPSWNKVKSQTADPGEARRVMRMRDQGQTKIIGDPLRRAAFVYYQNGRTCGIAAQVQVLMEFGRVAPGHGPQAEDELYARAVRQRLFSGAQADLDRRTTGGTPSHYVGDLLDMPIKKHFDATDQELFSAAKTGRMLIASFDTGVLRNDSRYAGSGHGVAVTGVEINRQTGEPLGYYINDTGTNQGGRFIPVKQFLDAWHRWGHAFIEPL